MAWPGIASSWCLYTCRPAQGVYNEQEPPPRSTASICVERNMISTSCAQAPKLPFRGPSDAKRGQHTPSHMHRALQEKGMRNAAQ